jgi:predicted HTH domain antitoxin
MSLVVSEEILRASGLSEPELLLEIVVMLFQQEKLTLAKASRLVGMDQIQFQRLLASREIPIHYDVAEFREDLKSLQENGWR